MKKILLTSLVTASVAMAVQDPNAFVTHTEMGYIKTGGNTETEAFNLDAKAKKAWDKHVLGLAIDAQYAKDGADTTKNKFAIEGNYDYMITERFAFSYLAGYKNDKFSSFDYQAYTGPGAKYLLIKEEKQNLAVEGNILYEQDKYKDMPPVDGHTENYAAYRVKAIYDLQLLENLKFDQELSYRNSFKDPTNYFAYSKSALTSKLSDMFSAGLSYKVDYVNEPGDKKSTDTTLTANLIMDF
jgi:putative salt-induced outer membrane protein